MMSKQRRFEEHGSLTARQDNKAREWVAGQPFMLSGLLTPESSSPRLEGCVGEGLTSKTAHPSSSATSLISLYLSR